MYVFSVLSASAVPPSPFASAKLRSRLPCLLFACSFVYCPSVVFASTAYLLAFLQNGHDPSHLEFPIFIDKLRRVDIVLDIRMQRSTCPPYDQVFHFVSLLRHFVGRYFGFPTVTVSRRADVEPDFTGLLGNVYLDRPHISG